MSLDRDALLKEVDEELQRERFQKIWDQYGTYLIGAAVAVVVGIGGYNYWQGRKQADAERAGLRFEAALALAADGKGAEAAQAFSQIAASSSASYPVLAQLAVAGQAVKDGKTDAAIAAYDTVAQRAPDVLIKDFARLQSAALKIDSADFTEVQNRLNDLVRDESPWRFLAREIVGVAALRAGRLTEARNSLLLLSADPRAPAAVRDRAGRLMNLVVAAEQERTAPATVEFEKTDPPPAEPAAAPAAAPAPAPKAGPRAAPKSQIVPRSK